MAAEKRETGEQGGVGVGGGETVPESSRRMCRWDKHCLDIIGSWHWSVFSTNPHPV